MLARSCPGRTRTFNLPLNRRPLYRLSYKAISQSAWLDLNQRSPGSQPGGFNQTFPHAVSPERQVGIEPTLPPWHSGVLPIYDSRNEFWSPSLTMTHRWKKGPPFFA